MFDLSEEIIVITGGTGSIGKSFARALIDSGAKVVLWGRGKSAPLEDVLEEVAQEEGQREKLSADRIDVSIKEEVEKGLCRVREKVGVPTVLINGVGGNRGKAPFVEADLNLFQEIIQLNLLGGFMIPTQVFAEFWIRERIPAGVINLASMTSFIPLSGVWAYNAAKAGVMNLTMAAAKEFAPYGIRVNAIAPGFFVGHQNRNLLYTDYEKGILSDRGKAILARTPFNRFGKAEDLYGTVVFLASRKASGFLTGVTIPVDGGYLIDSI